MYINKHKWIILVVLCVYDIRTKFPIIKAKQCWSSFSSMGTGGTKAPCISGFSFIYLFRRIVGNWSFSVPQKAFLSLAFSNPRSLESGAGFLQYVMWKILLFTCCYCGSRGQEDYRSEFCFLFLPENFTFSTDYPRSWRTQVFVYPLLANNFKCSFHSYYSQWENKSSNKAYIK